MAGEGGKQGESVLGGCDGVATGRVHDDDAALGGGLEVDVVHPCAGTGHDLEAAGVGERIGRDLGLAAHDQGLVAGERLTELPGRETRADVDLGLLLEQGDTLVRNGVCNEDSGAGAGFGHDGLF